MNICATVSVQATTGGGQELAGATDGQAWLTKVRQQAELFPSGVCIIDFEGVRLATVSWLREAVLGLSKFLRLMRPEVTLVFANLRPLVKEEFKVALEATGQVAVVVGAIQNGTPVAPEVIGRLDPALEETFKVVEGRAEFDASVVCGAVPGVAPSAANNRLAALEAKGLLISKRRGRSRIYQPILENLRYGN
jgi:DNA-binding transcriptional ArsR family regulator